MTTRTASRATAALLAFFLWASGLPALAIADSPIIAEAAAHALPTEETYSSVVVSFADGDVDPADLEAIAQTGLSLEDVEVGRDGMVAIELAADADAELVAASLATIPEVEVAAPGVVLSVFEDGAPNDDYYLTRGRWVTSRYRNQRVEVYQRRYLGPQELFPHSIQMEPLWAVAPDNSEPVRVAVLDTGFTTPSGDVDPLAFVPMGDYTDRDPNTGRPTQDVSDGHGHGTMVATTIAASTGNSIGMAGAVGRVPVQILVYKVLRDDGTSRPEGVFDINEAIMDAVDAGARVVNCSFGNATAARSDLGEAFRPAIEYATAHGVLVVAAAGNGALDYVVPPAAVPEVIAVGSIDYVDGTLSSFSNRGRGLDIVATGESLPVLAPGTSGVRIANGTSFAAPLVSGALALLCATVPEADAGALEAAVLAGADPYPADSPNTTSYGAGKLDAHAAYLLLGGSPKTDLAVRRHAGASRYDTAATVSRTQYPDGAPAAILASGESWPDALSAGVLASAVGGPLLLTATSDLPAETRRELIRLNPSEIIVVGGDSAVSGRVVAAIRAAAPGARIVRLAGRDRYATARAISDELTARTVARADTAVLASGMTFPDALAAVPMAARAGWPILLTDPRSLPAPTLEALRGAQVSRVVVVGGTATVTESVVRSLRSSGFAVERIAGTDRYATARAIADWAVTRGVLEGEGLGVATGMNFPDALAGGPYMAGLGAPMILADSVSSALASWLGCRHGCVAELHVFGSPRVVGPTTAGGIAGALAAR